MKRKKYMILILAIVFIAIIINYMIYRGNRNGSTLESRQLQLREIERLGENVTIIQELMIDDYIISGYTSSSNQYGLAIFASRGNGNYEFETDYTRQNDRLIHGYVMVNSKCYDLFWANRDDLDYAEVIYESNGLFCELKKMDAKDNKILYMEAPSDDYRVEYYFFDLNGNKYE